MKLITVCAAFIMNGSKVLIAGRPPEQKLYLDKWEFPGGKLDRGESPGECVRRELLEETGLAIIPLDQIYMSTYSYPDKTVELHFIRALRKDSDAEPQALDGQKFQWIELDSLGEAEFLPADIEFAQFLLLSAKS